MAADDRWWGARARLQVAAWRGSSDTVVLTPVPERPAPAVGDVHRELDALAARGITKVLTGALHHGELTPFVQAGFIERERLHLLRHDLDQLPEPTGACRHRRAWRRDHPAILDIDERAFDDFWSLDRAGLADALAATPISRFRVATDSTPVGYAITGRAGRRGYLQRLAVDPDRHRHGIGGDLVADSLRWLRRGGASVAVVNTQVGNHGALALYLRAGFVPEPHGLTVLSHGLAGPPS
ncbi:MAG: GNAT family N-acetyltransferase [Acidimicrobiales bacterium]|nr:GNAT family N-acetyltransferase [Acidimicrobiales bacterium]